MVPELKNNFATEAVSLLTSMYQDKNAVLAILAALMAEVQELETAAQELVQGCLINNATGDALDKIGTIVGVSRNGQSDTDFRVTIQIQIKVNGSMGRAEDIISIASLVTGLVPVYSESQPAAWQIVILELLHGVPQVITALHRAKAAGTYGTIVYSNWTPTTDVFFWDDAITPIGLVGMSDSLNPDSTALFTSGQSI